MWCHLSYVSVKPGQGVDSLGDRFGAASGEPCVSMWTTLTQLTEPEKVAEVKSQSNEQHRSGKSVSAAAIVDNRSSERSKSSKLCFRLRRSVLRCCADVKDSSSSSSSLHLHCQTSAFVNARIVEVETSCAALCWRNQSRHSFIYFIFLRKWLSASVTWMDDRR